MVIAKVGTVMRWYAQDIEDEVNQEENEHDVDGMKKEADSTAEVMHVEKISWRGWSNKGLKTDEEAIVDDYVVI